MGSEIFGPELHYLVAYSGNGKATWSDKYPGEKWPGKGKVEVVYIKLLRKLH